MLPRSVSTVLDQNQGFVHAKQVFTNGELNLQLYNLLGSFVCRRLHPGSLVN